MTRMQKKYLFDISESIRLIFEEYLVEVNTYEQYEADLKTEDAVKRRLKVISEALYRIRCKGVQLPFGEQIINRRNTIAHQYDEISPKKIFHMTRI